MALEALDHAPKLDDFTLLSEHQAQTPGTFFGGKPVLHLYAEAATVKVEVDQYESHPELKQLVGSNAPVPSDGKINITHIDVWVTSRHLLLYSPAASSGLQISYPTIGITAQDGADVLLELNLSDADTADEEIVNFQIRIFATKIDHHSSPATDPQAQGTNGTTSHNDTATALWKAIFACQELNPDPPAPGEEDAEGEGAFDETAPGATGWITSENMADFMDENGNFRVPTYGGEEEDGQEQPLGEGAGRTRTADELDDADEETKWRRTENE